MVFRNVYRAFKGKRGKTIRPAYTMRGVGRYIVADRQKRRYYRAKPFGKVKRITNTTDFDNVTSTMQSRYLTDIDGGVGVSNRINNHIKLHSFRMKCNLLWDAAGTPANTIRVILASVEAREMPTGVTISSNLYGRIDHPSILHVYKDIRFIRKDSTQLQTTVNIRQNFTPCLNIKYTDTSNGETTVKRDLVLIVVSDVAGATSDLHQMRHTLEWTE